MTAIECSIVVKDSENKLVSKYLVYDSLNLDTEDKNVNRMVKETLDKFKSELPDERPSIILKTTMVIQS